jgi:hypothetical protein
VPFFLQRVLFGVGPTVDDDFGRVYFGGLFLAAGRL